MLSRLMPCTVVLCCVLLLCTPLAAAERRSWIFHAENASAPSPPWRTELPAFGGNTTNGSTTNWTHTNSTSEGGRSTSWESTVSWLTTVLSTAEETTTPNTHYSTTHDVSPVPPPTRRTELPPIHANGTNASMSNWTQHTATAHITGTSSWESTVSWLLTVLSTTETDLPATTGTSVSAITSSLTSQQQHTSVSSPPPPVSSRESSSQDGPRVTTDLPAAAKDDGVARSPAEETYAIYAGIAVGCTLFGALIASAVWAVALRRRGAAPAEHERLQGDNTGGESDPEAAPAPRSPDWGAAQQMRPIASSYSALTTSGRGVEGSASRGVDANLFVH